jgi:aldose 1-epimerase
MSRNLIALLVMIAAHAAESRTVVMKGPYGTTDDGTPVDIFVLRSEKLQASITNYGGIVVALRAPDRKGQFDDVVLGFDDLSGYLKTHPYFGALVGRYANRIANAKFVLDGHPYTLAKNDGENSLHGGLKGFDKKVWEARVEGDGILLSYRSRDGEEGYPGNLAVSVRYTVVANELRIEYWATTDRTTVLNLTNHSYFNLAGQGNGNVLKHKIEINADRFTPINQNLIPTGELKSVEGTPFDFRSSRAIGERIEANDPQLKLARGYDHNFVLKSCCAMLSKAARVYEPTSGRVLEVFTTQPGIQLYTGNFLDGTITGKGGKVYQRRYAFCLETQHFPDSPNQPSFPSVTLKPSEKFEATTVFRFSARR